MDKKYTTQKAIDALNELDAVLVEKLRALSSGDSYIAYIRCQDMIRQVREYRHGVELLEEEIAML
ncbi:MAG: hypothetical protein IKK34_06810 [Clostridia bacterium]|nr:hypothetical protein [Clostridia bacterium]